LIGGWFVWPDNQRCFVEVDAEGKELNLDRWMVGLARCFVEVDAEGKELVQSTVRQVSQTLSRGGKNR